MTTTSVYALEPELEVYQALLLDLPDDDPRLDEYFSFGGTPRSAIWKPPPVSVDRPDLLRPQLWSLVGAAVLVFNDMVRTELGPGIEVVGELLPLYLHDEHLNLLNILSVVNCLDKGSSDFEAFRGDTYAFIEHRLPETGLFKVPETATTDVLYVEREDDAGGALRARVEGGGLTGYQLRLLWDSARGAHRVTPPWG